MLTQTPLTPAWVPQDLPVVEPQDFPPRAKKSTAHRVLVVDDEALVRWSVAETLLARGYEVVEASDGRSAIAAMGEAAAPPDVVLLDLRLPDSSDLGLLQTLRRLAPRVPVILMTAFGTQDVVDAALEIGASFVVSKPFEMSDLAPLVSRALGTSRS